MLRAIRKISDKPRHYVVDFLKDGSYFENIVCDQNELTYGLTFKEETTLSNAIDVKDIVSNQDCVYLTTDREVYKYQKGQVNLIFTSKESHPKVYLLGEYLEDYALISTEQGITLFGKDARFFPLPKSEYYTVCNGLIFGGCNSEVFFCYLPATKYEQGVKINKIKLDESYGKIMGLTSVKQKVYAVTERAIYSLSPDNNIENATVERLALDGLKVTKGSIKAFSDGFYFINDGNICYFSNDDVKVVHKVQNWAKIDKNSRCQIIENTYLFGVTKHNKKGYYTYDLTKECAYFTVGENLFITSNGIAFDNRTKSLGKLTFENMPSQSKYCSKPLDFKSYKIKSLVGMDLLVDGSAKVNLKGDFGDLDFNVKGRKRFDFGLVSKDFLLTIEGLSQDFTFKQIILKYKMMED